MVDGGFNCLRVGIIMDYRVPADTDVTSISTPFLISLFDPVQFQIIDITGKGSRRVVGLTVNARDSI